MALKNPMDQDYKALLEKQKYGFAGETTAVKICGWTKKSILNEGSCYKQKFYGIRSNKCCQMSPAVNTCSLQCSFCWRDRYESPFDIVDDPEKIIDESLKQQKKLLIGYKGNAKADPLKFAQSNDVKHFAISLTGEPTSYPKLGEFIRGLHKRGISSFVVTNGMFPHAIERLEKMDALPTQLYVSVDAPNKELFYHIDNPIKSLQEPYNKLMNTLDILNRLDKEGKTRTTIRITLIKGINMVHPEQWGALMRRANPKFLEVKGYSWVGTSRERLLLENSPRHHEVKEFAEEIGKHCGYHFIDDQERSRVVLMMKEDTPDRIMTWDD